jgi:hypothetical protein
MGGSVSTAQALRHCSSKNGARAMKIKSFDSEGASLIVNR